MLFLLFYIGDFLKDIFYNLIFIYKSYLLVNGITNNTLDKKTVDDYKCVVKNTGVFAIKLVQWGLNRFKLLTSDDETETLLEDLEIFYENCPFHSEKYTKEIFKSNFNYNLEDKYSIERIASGSIAQVYKCDNRDKCLNVTTEEVTIDPSAAFITKVTEFLNDIQTKVASDTVPLTDGEKSFLSMVSLPVMKRVG